MKYIRELQQETNKILHRFIKNEPEDTEEYAKLLEIKKAIDEFTSKEYLKCAGIK